MNLNHSIRLFLVLSTTLVFTIFVSCTEESGKKTNTDVAMPKKSDSTISQQATKAKPLSACDKFQLALFPTDSIKQLVFDEILSTDDETIPLVNKNFLRAMARNPQDSLVIYETIFPVFKPQGNEPRITAVPKLIKENDNYVESSLEADITSTYIEAHKLEPIPENGTQYFKGIIQDNFTPIPEFFYFTETTKEKATVTGLGKYSSDCLNYYFYTFKGKPLKPKTHVLFGSPFPLELTFNNYPAIDSLLIQDNDQCLDCPNDLLLQQTFAQVKGIPQLYFVYTPHKEYANTDSDKTPMRALVYITKDNKPLYLWYDALDVFGCDCL